MQEKVSMSLNLTQNSYLLRYFVESFQQAKVDYPYSFNGMEKDDEIKGVGNSVNYKYRMQDPRLGRFFTIDPLTSKYPHYTPYSFSGNKLTAWRELEGLEEYYAVDGTRLGKAGSSTEIRVVNDKKNWIYFREVRDAYHSDNPFITLADGTVIEVTDEVYSQVEQNLLDNSTKAYMANQEQLFDIFRRWGKHYLPLSENEEYGMVVYSNTLTDESGDKFNVIIQGTTVANGDGNRNEVDVSESEFKIPTRAAGERIATFDSGENGWEPYAVIHTHPSGGSEKRGFSPQDMGYSLQDDLPYYMLQFDVKLLMEFSPSQYNSADPIPKFSSNSNLIPYSKNDFDYGAVVEAVEAYQFFLNK